MKYGSICSGVAPQTEAWAARGAECVWFAEIEPFPSAVLKYRFPHIPNLGDFTKIGPEHGPIDLLIGGTPCQAFSVAGLRNSLSDERGNLTLEFVRLADRLRVPRILWENVPGVLSTPDNAFGCFLGALVGADSALVPARGQRWTDCGLVTGPKRTAAWVVKDAQFYGVAQRRRRVFVFAVLGTGNWSVAEALFPQFDGLQGYLAPRREKGKRVAATITNGFGERGLDAEQIFNGNYDIAKPLGAHGGSGYRQDLDNETYVSVAHSLRGEGFDASEDGTGRGIPLVPEVCGTLSDGAHMGGGLNGQDAYTGRIIPCVAGSSDASDGERCEGSEELSGRRTSERSGSRGFL